MKNLVLLSGGIDSTVAMLESKAEAAISFDYGQTHRRELDAARLIAEHYGIEQHVFGLSGITGNSALTGDAAIPVHHAEAPDATEVPGRNLLMVAAAIPYAITNGFGGIVIGANADDRAGYPDCRPDFITALDDTTRAGYGITVWAPLLRMDKRFIVDLARRYNVPIDLTWSCYRGGETPCNQCGACESRNEAMK